MTGKCAAHPAIILGRDEDIIQPRRFQRPRRHQAQGDRGAIIGWYTRLAVPYDIIGFGGDVPRDVMTQIDNAVRQDLGNVLDYPDYAIGAKTNLGEENAKMIVESKFQLIALSEFTDNFYQAKS